MAAATTIEAVHNGTNGVNNYSNSNDDPFLEADLTTQQPYIQRLASRFEDNDYSAASSPSQLKRILEAHLVETERRLQDTHKLGTSLLQQQSELQDKLHEVQQQQEDAEIAPELKQRLASIGREHDDVSREIARSLLAPRFRAVSGEDKLIHEATTLSSQATGSPTKISAPNRRSRNQPVNQAEDLQFAADISTSLLAQVRQLQAAVAERDEALKIANSDRLKLDQDVQLLAQKIRSHDENEQRYKDETWNLESQNHQLYSAQREAAEKEMKLNTAIAIATAEKSKLLSEVEEFRLAHSKATEEYETSKKAHEAELHSLKRDFDVADTDRLGLQNKIDELTAQNQQLARAMGSRFRDQSPQKRAELENGGDDLPHDFSTPEQSPPPSPTKATPRHGGLESETLKSSLQHAYKMNQILKSNIHREKTEKIELKRMLQDARDELESRRNDPSAGNGVRKQKQRNEVFKKPLRPDMLGGSRRARTDVDMQDDEWEDQAALGSSSSGVGKSLPHMPGTYVSDTYLTGNETESNFETADEIHTAESEAFETGAESLAGDSTDELTETESTAPRTQRSTSHRQYRPSLAFKSAGTRDSYLSTASTSAGEEDEMQTPVQPQPSRFKIRNNRSSSARHTQVYEGTPDSMRSQGTMEEFPATVTSSRSPPGVEQSLFAELEGMYDTGSNFSTPARPGTIDMASPSSMADTPSRIVSTAVPDAIKPKPVMVDSAMMTEPWQPEPVLQQPTATVMPMTDPTLLTADSMHSNDNRVVSMGDFPLPPTIPVVANQQTDTGTQYTPQKSGMTTMTNTTPQQSFEHTTQYTPSKAHPESPMRGVNNFITPPRTVWDVEHESEIGSPDRNFVAGLESPRPVLGYSDMVIQDLAPQSPAKAVVPPLGLTYSTILSQQTLPIIPPPSLPPTGPLPAIPSPKQDRSNTEKVAAGAATGGILAGAAAALGLTRSRDKGDAPQVLEDATSRNKEIPSHPSEQPLKDISGNAVLRSKGSLKNRDLHHGAPVSVSSNDQGSQTMLSSEEIENALRLRKSAAAVPIAIPTAGIDIVPDLPSKSVSRSPVLSESRSFTGASTPTSPPLRPSSASSNRPSTANKQHPPLPFDYKTNIARANSLVQNNAPKRESNTPAVGSVMGPPLVPASAMRRPKTPAESTRSPSRENATPRTVRSVRTREGTESQLSHRSSVSSFASELDERFNIRNIPAGNGFEPAPGTDPRMIQAITQTMIGEYLWKYTRKTGSKEMSSTRHKRYFWVHPYTKTLYWSTTDPSVPGAKESTSRSVPIESIRVVSDDNPLPPGLHRKSLEITTPNRKVKFTASTGQRHETWFNALSYLLLRGEATDTQGAYTAGGNEITRDDLDEFRVTSYDPHLVPASRQSMSSYNSRTTAGTSKRISTNASTSRRQPLPSNVVGKSNQLQHQGSIARDGSVPGPSDSGRASRADQQRASDKDRTVRTGSVSRVSKVLGSITGRTSRQSIHDRSESQQSGYFRGASRQSNSIYNASVVSATRDSAEEAREEMLRQEAMGLGGSAGLENVRACCDGKHDVSNLPHVHTERHRAFSSMSDRINRSMSRRA